MIIALGSWSDQVGRKKAIVPALIGCSIRTILCKKNTNFKTSLKKPTNYVFMRILCCFILVSFVSKTDWWLFSTLLAFVVICLVIISKWPPLSHRLLWFW